MPVFILFFLVLVSRLDLSPWPLSGLFLHGMKTGPPPISELRAAGDGAKNAAKISFPLHFGFYLVILIKAR